MKTEYSIYRVGDAPPEPAEIDWPENPGYDLIEALIKPILDGALLAHVTVLHDGKRADMFVDEFGATGLKTGYPLPINRQATKTYRHNWMTQHPETDPTTLPAIHGTAVLFKRIVWK